MDENLKCILSNCLSRSAQRATPAEIKANTIFENILLDPPATSPNPSLLLRCPLKHIYYWWQLAGGDVQAELNKEGLIRSEAPILMMPQ